MNDNVLPTPAEEVDFLGGRLSVAAKMGCGDEDTVLIHERMAPRHFIELHSHRDPECFVVLRGALEIFLLDDTPGWRPVGVGESALAANGVKHAIRNPTDEPVEVVILTNNRLAGYFETAGRRVQSAAPFAAPSKEDVERAAEVSRRYGYWRASSRESAEITGAG